jgi:hypothetical protein
MRADGSVWLRMAVVAVAVVAVASVALSASSCASCASCSCASSCASCASSYLSVDLDREVDEVGVLLDHLLDTSLFIRHS